MTNNQERMLIGKLEELVDNYSIGNVIDKLADVCLQRQDDLADEPLMADWWAQIRRRLNAANPGIPSN